MKRILTSKFLCLLILLITFETGAKKKKPYPHAEIKVGYTYHNIFVRGSDGIVKKDISYVLLANKEHSKFYSPDTESKDSLQSTPKGRAIHKQIFDDAVRRYSETKDKSAMNAVVYRTNMYVFRSIPENIMTVYDYVGGLDYAYCTDPLVEIKWEIADSTKNVLGYECIMASANYHGRDWTAWFTPEIPISEGPWKLTGLPGLILEATESTGQHSFVANGLETSDQEIVPIYPYKQYEKMSRIDMLRQLYNYRNHGNSINSALTGIDFGTDHIKNEEEAKIDFLETDYH